MKRTRPFSRPSFCLAATISLVSLTSCSSEPGPGPSAPVASASASVSAAASASAPTPETKAPPTRAEWNRRAVELALPLFWIDDKNGSGAPDADEIAVLWGMPDSTTKWIEGGKPTAAFEEAHAKVVALHQKGPNEEGLSDAEKKRRAAVREELAQGRPALLRSDFRSASTEDRAIVEHVLAAAKIVERIYQKQVGSAALAKDLPKDDPASAMLFHRNQSPFCEQPKTEGDPACTAIWPRPAKISGLYPASLQKDPKFCEALDKDKDAERLFFQFAAVTEEGGKLAATPYNVIFKDDMAAAAAELTAAAKAITSKEEAALKEYLLAAAKAFGDNDWPKADAAWAKMGATNSKYYLRIGPDEVYFEPCSRKAGFHVSFARINQDSLAWQKRLEPVKKDMEAALAKMAGKPYKARDVKFKLPDFIDIIVNAGDSRAAVGGTIGQSLPNWGPVAKKGGRTVAMTNLYTDKDSNEASEKQMRSVFCKSVMEEMSFEPSLLTMSTVLHEAAHNLGPSHEYQVDGKTDSAAFGGALASTLEELKAQTAALYFADWLAEKGIIDEKQAARSHLRDVAWAFGHIAQGMYDAEGRPKPYSQLASIQVGWLRTAGVVKWNAEETAANGADKGCFTVSLPEFRRAVVSLAETVLMIKAQGNKERAIKLRQELVDADDDWKKLRETIRERWLRVPKTSFVYAVEM